MVFVSCESVPDRIMVVVGLLVGTRPMTSWFPRRPPGLSTVAEVKQDEPVKFADPLTSRSPTELGLEVWLRIVAMPIVLPVAKDLTVPEYVPLSVPIVFPEIVP